MTTGYVFDEIFKKHDYPGHPECADRLTAIMAYLEQHALLPQLSQIRARSASLPELVRCHTPHYVKMVEQVSEKGGGMLDPDTYANKHSYRAAVKAAGGLIDLTHAVVEGKLNNGFAFVRPPGHHAELHGSMGFCLFGTVAIAARAARHDNGLERVAIIDFDVHHGNGTQDILNDNPHIMFVSSHQFPFYPGTGNYNEIGQGAARGTKINLPLEVNTEDEGMKRLYSEIVFPMLRRFEPQLILVSAGYDAHWQDPLANIGLSLTGYQWLSQQLFDLAGELCEGKIVFTLEGGYNIPVLAAGVGNSVRVLLGQEGCDDPFGPSPHPKPDVDLLVRLLKRTHDLE
ncbi:histone deacetylase [Anaerolineales bacterium HSG6]|nr:histone deacetylase [Anaerolineales bacterium HSG6]MDM8531157.1 histone deacetylase [Anaerolineales bacterium HSG25]